MKKSMLDEKGVDFLTMRTAVVLLAAALLISASAVFVKGYEDNLSRDRARQAADSIAAFARTEYAMGCPGTGSSTGVFATIPGCVKRMVFGRAPEGERNNRAYFIEFLNGMVESRVSEVPFTYGDTASGHSIDAGVALFPGEYALELMTLPANDTYTVAVFGGTKC